MRTAGDAVAGGDRAIDRRRTRPGVPVGAPAIGARIEGSHVTARIGGARLERRIARRRVTGSVCAISARIGPADVDPAVERNADITTIVVFGRAVIASIAPGGRIPIFDRRGSPILLERR
jgi:hypothetical protein